MLYRSLYSWLSKSPLHPKKLLPSKCVFVRSLVYLPCMCVWLFYCVGSCIVFLYGCLGLSCVCTTPQHVVEDFADFVEFRQFWLFELIRAINYYMWSNELLKTLLSLPGTKRTVWARKLKVVSNDRRFRTRRRLRNLDEIFLSCKQKVLQWNQQVWGGGLKPHFKSHLQSQLVRVSPRFGPVDM